MHQERSEQACWDRSMRIALDDSISHLQQLLFNESWEEIRTESGSDEQALRASLQRYERGLVDLLGFFRRSGAVGDGLAWSTFKTNIRRASREANEEISLRTALDEALYQVERIPPGDPATYQQWRGFLIQFLGSRAGDPADIPDGTADESDRIAWAVTRLLDLEEHEQFQHALIEHVRSVAPESQAETHAALALQDRLILEPRFDLVINSSLRWVAGCI